VLKRIVLHLVCCIDAPAHYFADRGRKTAFTVSALMTYSIGYYTLAPFSLMIE